MHYKVVHGGGAANPDPRELRNASVEPIYRKYLELRYRLLPYIYTAARACCDTGMPIIRAMWLHYPDEPDAVAAGDQYLWGRDVMVAPVVDRGATSRRLYLPQGTWYDFWTDARVEGGRWINRGVDLDTIPLCVRAGAVIPLDPVRQFTSEPVDGPLTLVVYPGAAGAADVYEDDGVSFEHKRGNYMRLMARWNDGRRTLRLSLASGSRLIGGAARWLEIRQAGHTRTQSVRFDGSPVVMRI
jgi:alpha-glucosidase (family GH31 glycosyl hydrolase)